MFSIIAIGIAAIAAMKTYNRAVEIDPELTGVRIDNVFKGAELLRTIAAFVTSLLLVLKGAFRPMGQIQPRQGGLSFGNRLAADAD